MDRRLTLLSKRTYHFPDILFPRSPNFWNKRNQRWCTQNGISVGSKIIQKKFHKHPIAANLTQKADCGFISCLHVRCHVPIVVHPAPAYTIVWVKSSRLWYVHPRSMTCYWVDGGVLRAFIQIERVSLVTVTKRSLLCSLPVCFCNELLVFIPLKPVL